MPSPPIVLTAREWQIAAALADGFTNAEIAEQHGISPNTVRNTLSLIYLKAGVSNRVMLANLLITGRVVPRE